MYRRRRLFVGAILLLVLSLAVGGFVAISNAISGATPPAGASDSARQGTPGAPSPGPAASGGQTPSPSQGCDAKLVTVTAATDKPTYAPGQKPLLTLKVTNGNRVPCEVNIGTSQMEYVITSGSDRIFSSRDCQAESKDLVKTLAPGRSETANFLWGRNRTVEGCTAVAAQPAAGTYVFTARLGTRTSPKAVFQLG